MVHRTRLITLVCGIALVFAAMGTLQAVPAQDHGPSDRLRLTLPPANNIGPVKNAGSLFGVTPAAPVQAPSLGQPVLISGNMGQQGQRGQQGQFGSFGQGGNVGSFGSFGSFGTTGSFGSFGSFGTSGSFGSFGTFGGGQIGALGGQIGSFGGGSFGKFGGAFGANGAIGL